MDPTVGTERGTWRGALEGAVAFVLLLPVPAFAVFSYDWQSISSGWTFTGSTTSNVLEIVPEPGLDNDTIVIRGQVTNLTDERQDITTSFSGLSAITIVSGNLQIDINQGILDMKAANQFTASNQPNDAAVNALVGTGKVAKSKTEDITIRFRFAGGAQWNINSSPIRLTFTE